MQEALSRLVYRSRSALKGTPEECLAQVSGILRASRANNAAAGLSGVLLFDGISFLQVVEGPIASIERLYEAIACDRRHEEIDLVDLIGIEAREYQHWSMAFLDGTDGSRTGLQRFLAWQADANAARLGSAVSDALRALLSQPE